MREKNNNTKIENIILTSFDENLSIEIESKT